MMVLLIFLLFCISQCDSRPEYRTSEGLQTVANLNQHKTIVNTLTKELTTNANVENTPESTPSKNPFPFDICNGKITTHIDTTKPVKYIIDAFDEMNETVDIRTKMDRARHLLPKIDCLLEVFMERQRETQQQRAELISIAEKFDGRNLFWDQLLDFFSSTLRLGDHLTNNQKQRREKIWNHIMEEINEMKQTLETTNKIDRARQLLPVMDCFIAATKKYQIEKLREYFSKLFKNSKIGKVVKNNVEARRVIDSKASVPRTTKLYHISFRDTRTLNHIIATVTTTRKNIHSKNLHIKAGFPAAPKGLSLSRGVERGWSDDESSSVTHGSFYCWRRLMSSLVKPLPGHPFDSLARIEACTHPMDRYSDI